VEFTTSTLLYGVEMCLKSNDDACFAEINEVGCDDVA